MSDGFGGLLGIAQQLLGSEQQQGHGAGHDDFLQGLSQRLLEGHEPVQNGVTYEIDEKFFSPTHDFWIKNSQGQKVFQVDDKLFSFSGALALQDAQGNELYRVSEKIMTLRDIRYINRGDQRIATVHKALFSPLVYKFTVTFENGAELHVAGNITDHQYAITYGQQEVAHISRKWSLLSEHYGVTIVPGQDDALLLTISACVEDMVIDD
ncbi:LURP-one-related/scramblase family protein [Kitasatospora mediocidica]|uniref:LURP-one-related/scramblase family protein n=1 Tax=Kitasatospora mediocidica TaxID=58352 RepID=UPI00068B75DF|nr:LURP-one-related family protein [Kitasatospora mediocidica]